MPSMEEIFNVFSAEEMILPNEPLWFWKVDLEYAYKW